MDDALDLAQINEHVSGFDRLYGLELLALTPQEVRGRVRVREEVKQPYGLIHGGLYAAIAESLASLGTALAVAAEGSYAVGLANSTNFLRPIVAGAVNACARPLHRGRTTWVWEVECRDDRERLCALTRMTIAVRPGSPPQGEPAQPPG
ncbi:MAG TPA: PaaI family thioesterase [Solirubrobacteraceae bacterium]|nr:PaaI family thioesterase [Solirubrobacteraceae bacterium]